jgi:beta-barrel assembly-enhancing protease
VVDTSEFQDVKARLARIENKRKPKPGEGNNKPTLRRASSSRDPNDDPADPAGGNQPSDSRPTLSRRQDE